MALRDEIIRIISENAYIPISVTESSNLYRDLGFDSLSFISLLSELEDLYGVVFDIGEMEPCLIAGQLIAAVENKLEGCEGRDQAFSFQPE